jgi:hypothetical protein
VLFHSGAVIQTSKNLRSRSTAANRPDTAESVCWGFVPTTAAASRTGVIRLVMWYVVAVRRLAPPVGAATLCSTSPWWHSTLMSSQFHTACAIMATNASLVTKSSQTSMW